MKDAGFVCGIDGGGTRTTVLCRFADGQDVRRSGFGPLNLNSIGDKAFRETLEGIIGYISGLGRCRALCLGVSGITNADVRRVAGSVLSGMPFPYRIMGDHEIAHTGALDRKEGLILISGTGSVCYGRTADGKSAFTGGWGHLIGDQGSGYALGRDALIAVAKVFDGYGKSTVLKDMLAGELGLDTEEKIVSYVYSNDKSAIASLSPLVDRACRQGDGVASAIVEANARELADIVIAAAGKLGFVHCDVALLGGLMEHPTCLKETFIRLLNDKAPGLSCAAPLHDAAEGAVMEAERLIVNLREISKKHNLL